MADEQGEKVEKALIMVRAEKAMRYRVNISRGMKGGISFESTVDGEGFTMEEILGRSDKLVAELEARYPAAPEAGKKE